jgi:hypothetical protein
MDIQSKQASDHKLELYADFIGLHAHNSEIHSDEQRIM